MRYCNERVASSTIVGELHTFNGGINDGDFLESTVPQKQSKVQKPTVELVDTK